ncbi:PDR/VanB family oxidoreductase [Methylobacterium sp. J-070]|uniref:PDR/VanB family oxidoreductase n=1 Tax=Methylobacterium sp. J-070 TaxID=2836650 RepID=UPI001FB97912|nr:PDR/VanB family oxidoreductase [Methylobacterium sp. J-070]MCJ2048433.1 PDR/VanB family oxidoreductase [Methylobacterium sp. J-070]
MDFRSPRNLFGQVTVTVVARRMLTARVVELELADPDGWDLPPFDAGAHVSVHLPEGKTRPYSLCGDPVISGRYRLAVLRQDDGRGGSAWIHEVVRVGDTLHVSLPRNNFPLAAEADHHLLIAGGIGLTPFLPMVDVLNRAGRAFHLHACAGSPEHMPYLRRLRELEAAGVATLHFDGGEPSAGLDVGGLLDGRGPDVHVYCCGPSSLMDAVRRATATWPEDRVHFERFQAEPTVPAGSADATVELARSGLTIAVPAGQSIARALLRHGAEIDVSCEAGTCGSCRTRYLSGRVDHRDVVLSAAERRDYMTPCVSGCAGERLLLDL